MQSICLLFLSTVAATYMIYWLRPVLMPLVVAFFVVSGVSPLLAALEKRLGVSRLIAAALAFMCGVFILVLFGCTILVSTLELARNSEGYRKRVRELVTEVERALPRGLLKREGEESSLFGLVPTFEPKPGIASPSNASTLEGGSGRETSELRSRDSGARKTDALSNSRSSDSESTKPSLKAESVDATEPKPENSDPDDSEQRESPASETNATEKESDSGEPDSASTHRGEEGSQADPTSAAPGGANADGERDFDDREDQEAASSDQDETTQDKEDETESGVAQVAKNVSIARSENDRPRRDSAVIREVESWQNEVTPYDPASTRAEEERQAVARATQLVDAFVRDGISIISQALVSLVSTSVVVLIYVFFLLMGTPSLATTPAVKEIDHQIRSYLSLKTVISIFTGLCFGFALRMFGVPMAFTFGVLAFLLNFVPNVGPIVASLLPIPLIIFHPDGTALWMITSITVICSIQLVSGNIVEPKIMGDSSDLHPVTILVALMFWGMMWGIIGMFLATPITSAMKIMFERFETTRPLANLMAGRWNEEDAQAVGFAASEPAAPQEASGEA